MISNLKKSLSTILHERTSSPFYGTLIVTWIIWNWKTVYLTLFISEDKIDVDKITYITQKLSGIDNLVIYPLISTAVILTLIPFVSNGAYWLNLKFDKWKLDKKNEIEKKQLLTLEQSIEIREQLISQESRFEKLLENKNNEIIQLKSIIEDSEPGENNIQTNIESYDDLDEISEKIKKIDSNFSIFQKILEFMRSGYKITDRSDIPSRLVTILEINDIIKSKGGGGYTLTEKGKELTKKIIE
jgi:hypothetical protein